VREPPRPALVRGLGTLDVTLLTVGAVVGTGIFLTPGSIAAAVPHPGLVLLVWLAGGALVLAGAFAYAELGTLFPRAGGLYQYLREAWGPVWGFLYGWTCLLVIMSGGIAAIAVGFGEYLGALVPFFSGERVAWRLALGEGAWVVRGSQLAAVLAILALTVANHFGLRLGALLQNALTAVKIGAVLGLAALGLVLAAGRLPDFTAPLPQAALDLLPGFGVAMVAALWTYDGWYAASACAGEVRDPERSLPRGLVLGAVTVIGIYLLANLAYLGALSIEELAGSPRAAEASVAAVGGPGAARWATGLVSVSAFGCLAATVLYSSRIYQPMAADGVFFARVAAIHPRWRTPVPALWLQSGWATAFALAGGYTELFTYVTFGGLLFHVGGGLALFRLRATRPEVRRPYRATGYPVLPALFVLGVLLVTGNTLARAPRESLFGLLVIGAGLPAYGMWRRAGRARAG
jgi:APA family basic amino acid/polyamine antiporter